MDLTATSPQSSSPSARAIHSQFNYSIQNPPAITTTTNTPPLGRPRPDTYSPSLARTSLLPPHPSGLQDGRSRESWQEFLQTTSDRTRPYRPVGHRLNSAFQPLHPRDSLSRQHSDSSSTGSVNSPASGRKRVYSTTGSSPGKKRTAPNNHSETLGSSSRGSVANPIDLTSPDRSSRPLGPGMYGRQNSSGNITLPRWQPDEEVSSCPVCQEAFGFLYRRHHCRKCGKVVCANCSPHRITIPRQFIVHPPSGTPSSSFAALTGLDLGSSAGSARDARSGPVNGLERPSSSSLSGGEVVRVCNPCVPDPNLSPPPQLPVDIASPRSLARPPGALDRLETHASSRPPRSSGDSSATLASRYNVMRVDRRPFQSYGSHGAAARPSGLPTAPGPSDRPIGAQPHIPQRSLSSAYHPLSGFRTTPLHQPHPAFSSHSSLAHSSRRATVSTGSTHHQPIPNAFSHTTQLARPQIAEEDECPVCGRELPAHGSHGDDSQRIAHVERCIAQHSAIPSLRRLSPAVPDPLDPASASAPSGSTAGPSGRMLIYKASEKDCTGPNGDELECVICLEEFAIGEELGRLECLCKFHRVGFTFWTMVVTRH